jgi:hypothetical protein
MLDYKNGQDEPTFDLDSLHPTARKDIMRLTKIQKEKKRKATAVFEVNSAVNELKPWVAVAKENAREEVADLVDALVAAVRSFEDFVLDSHENYYYRWYCRKEVYGCFRRCKNMLRDRINKEHKKDFQSLLALELSEKLKPPLAHVLSHVNKLPFVDRPEPEQCVFGTENYYRQRRENREHRQKKGGEAYYYPGHC